MPKPIKLSEADIKRFWSKIDKCGPDDCWEWTSLRYETGYGRFACTNNEYRAHRVAFALTKGDTQLLVCHTCDNTCCCNPAHLFAGTSGDNQRDCVNKGRRPDQKGGKNNYAKLTASIVRKIRTSYKNGWGQRQLAGKFDVSKALISRICRGEIWKHTFTDKAPTNHRAKLTESDVHEIRRLYRGGGWTQDKIAQDFDISTKQVSRICRHVSWAHI